MTSSLVGSEMCIRDRENAELWFSSRFFLCLASLGLRYPWSDQLGRSAGSCLLYTSDAADDM
eukprot:5160042-Prorocentrum_lima.AAC.1